jgi:hypothetical protein
MRCSRPHRRLTALAEEKRLGCIEIGLAAGQVHRRPGRRVPHQLTHMARLGPGDVRRSVRDERQKAVSRPPTADMFRLNFSPRRVM